ncbi:hypothetical protein DTO166G4_7901 [Paecilomyces variotii]|uniref:Uncharacterized protein n=1 Tax=Byssochlamys spectabilis TaxID=264951 RepID=A0A443HIT3_BYSSP|nr:hypothetical protein C8Q69DRAFT_408922 [Paecilomyces variotii]KAJ9210516.1 hypothetical protein DTO166G4_7901 [Paecilomyces variotii]KAJ9230415.1 hypothetical protein DTO166G5_7307 [Paecilomyces variotii]KAJ9232041.1 hypothetical protein DTO169E5_7681 [Paecilomyces variotii]KAJ9247062.1 hypothetical protein DTO207G8_8377 [Paecilomyces variotii]KAJ9290521.1 hypothetical protein DTO021C3_1786 [Paecilomyces variotii]
MSPGRVIEHTDQDSHLQTLARGFDALLVTVQILSCKEQELQRRLKYSHEEYLKLANRLPGGPSEDENAVANKIVHGDAASPEGPQTIQDMVHTLQQSGKVDDRALEAIKQGWESFEWVLQQEDSDSGLRVRSNPCLIAASARRSSALEKDFTTSGVQGTLRCPFAKPNEKPVSITGTSNPSKGPNGDVCGNDEALDPIKLERSQDKVSSPTASARSSAARCPIRYLDQHSPEEVAQYFENHKHEIPRSHAVCIRRYQRDSQSIRQLDAKYGSLVNMIQGLGVKHQVFLPGQSRTSGQGSSSASAERVERWAEDVSSKSGRPPTLTPVEEESRADDDDDRTGRFERPLREVRVGESPSRPWGIPVPLSHPTPPSAIQSPSATVPEPSDKGFGSKGQVESTLANPSFASAAPNGTPGRPAGRCPFHIPKQDAAAPSEGASRLQEPTLNEKTAAPEDPATGPHTVTPDMMRSTSPAPAQMVFNGPVFFGYSAEQTIALMQQLGNPGGSK